MMTKNGGNIMHSCAFLGNSFLGNGFVAAQNAANGELNAQLGNDLSKPGEEHFVSRASVIEKYMAHEQSKVLLFGWMGCPCKGIVKGRLNEENICYAGRQRADPSSQLMAYLQSREKDPGLTHSPTSAKAAAGSLQAMASSLTGNVCQMTNSQRRCKVQTQARAAGMPP
jgi:hypothetical protein